VDSVYNGEFPRKCGLLRWGLTVGGRVDDGRWSGDRKRTSVVRPQ